MNDQPDFFALSRPNSYVGRTLSRADVDRRLANEMPRILTETALRPYTEDGKVAGFMLSRVPEGTLLSDVGLRAGDVLTSINDTPIDGLPTLLGLWTSLQTADHLTAVVLRDSMRAAARCR